LTGTLQSYTRVCVQIWVVCQITGPDAHIGSRVNTPLKRYNARANVLSILSATQAQQFHDHAYYNEHVMVNKRQARVIAS
jgi:hypothetical protein